MPIKKRENNDSLAASPVLDTPYRVSPTAILKQSQTPRERHLLAFYKYAVDHVSPTDIPVDDLILLARTPLNDAKVDHTYRSRIKGRLSAIRDMCVECHGGSPKAARTCVQVDCPLWSFRTGANGMRGARKS